VSAQHSGMSPERWAQYPLEQQILMIGNEMNRAGKLVGPQDGDSRRRSYERVLALADLTIQTNRRPGLQRELLRWREWAGQLYVGPAADPSLHAALFRVLLLFTATSAVQTRVLPGLSFPRDRAPEPASA